MTGDGSTADKGGPAVDSQACPGTCGPLEGCTGGCVQRWLRRCTRRGTGGVTGGGTPPPENSGVVAGQTPWASPNRRTTPLCPRNSRGERSPSYGRRAGPRPVSEGSLPACSSTCPTTCSPTCSTTCPTGCSTTCLQARPSGVRTGCDLGGQGVHDARTNADYFSQRGSGEVRPVPKNRSVCRGSLSSSLWSPVRSSVSGPVPGPVSGSLPPAREEGERAAQGPGQGVWHAPTTSVRHPQGQVGRRNRSGSAVP